MQPWRIGGWRRGSRAAAFRAPGGAPALRRTLAACLLFVAPVAVADGPYVIGEHVEALLESPHPYPYGDQEPAQPVWSDSYSFPGARYLVFQFAGLDLAPGDRLEIRDPTGAQVLVYTGHGPRGHPGPFLSRVLRGDTAIFELFAGKASHPHDGYRIDRISRGLSVEELAARDDPEGIEAICGSADMEDAICYATPFPAVYDHARPAALIVMDGVELCSAWVASCDNHLITASHCTWDGGDFDSQAELDRMEFLFGYEEPFCGGDAATFEYSFQGGTFLENHHDLDYALIQAPAGEDPAATYGWLLLDDRLADVDEEIYIVGHPGGGPKEISLFSTQPEDVSGFCEVFSREEPPCTGGSVPEIGYHCDTQGGGYSGAPVLARGTDKVIALHHCAGCPNRGVRSQAIWSRNQSGAHPLPACSVFEDVGVVRLGAALYSCEAVVPIQVMDGSLRGAGLQDVQVWSGTEALPEAIWLSETASGSGVFRGAVPLTSGPSGPGDGALRVQHGDTVSVRYLDADDGQGGVDVPREDQAGIDCVAPVIGGIEASDVLGRQAMVRWATDEPTEGLLLHSGGVGWDATPSGGIAVQHEVLLTGLTACTEYLYQVEATDPAGNTAVDDAGGAYHRFETGVDVQPVYTDGHAVNIRDGKDAISTLTVTDAAAVVDVDVTVNITHTYMADLDVYLMGPGGLEVELSSDNGADGDGYVGTRFDDQADQAIVEGSAPFTGAFRPEQPLTLLTGGPAAGDWRLRVFDDSDGDTGTLESWSLHLRYPARPCGPQAAYEAHALVADACAPGVSGDGDGVWDPGEAIEFTVALHNDGTEPVTGLSARASSLTPGAVVFQDTASFPDLAPEATVASMSAYRLRLPEGMACGAPLLLRLEVTADQGQWVDTLVQTVGLPSDGAGMALGEPFDAGPPAGWTVIDGGDSTDTWYIDSSTDPLGCASPDPAPPITGGWAAIDSDCAGPVAMDEELWTPPLDLGSALSATLEFDHTFNRYTTEIAAVDLRSSLTGGNWVNLGTWVADTANPQHETLDLTAVAAGTADAQIRWHYHDANFEWYWYVDNVLVRTVAGPDCAMQVCTAHGAAPGEQTGVLWIDTGTLTWDADPTATGGYFVYRGTGTTLAALEEAALDSCLRHASAGAADVTADLAETPAAAGGILWYLVTGWNDEGGEGPAGDGTTLPRILDPTGPCTGP